jgi:glycosyltransferase involved in cell wall biosynthesis
LNTIIRNPILSICIPTFNRASLLDECLKSIIKSIENSSNFENLIEIIISDNCSTDETYKIANKFCNRYNFIKYHRNEINVIDLNFYIAVERASGKYVWIFGDDDIFNPNTLNTIFYYLYKDYTLIISNYSLWNYSLNKCLKQKYLDLDKLTEIYDHNTLMRIFGLRLAFISCVIIRRNTFLKFDKETYSRYVSTGFPFLLTVYFTQINNCNALYISNSVFIQRGSPKHAPIEWWYQTFLTGSNLIFDLLRNFGYSKSVVTRSKLNVLTNDIKQDIIYRKVQNESIIHIWKNIFITYYKFPINVFITLFYLFTPSLIFRMFFKIKNG